MSRITGYLRLMRPANIITAITDILAGITIAASLVNVAWGNIILLIISTTGLYGGGVVLNDVFDAELDKKERPERPIPSGLISKKSVTIFGITLLLIGIIAAALSNKETIFSRSNINRNIYCSSSSSIR